MSIIRKSFMMILVVTTAFAMASCGKHHKAKMMKKKAEKSRQMYAICNVDALAQTLSSGNNQFAVRKVADKAANYTYYMIAIRGAVNADKVRGAVCRFINANKCHLYWGNVANIAMIADQKAPWFPGDTTPHYLLSPIVTCNKVAN